MDIEERDEDSRRRRRRKGGRVGEGNELKFQPIAVVITPASKDHSYEKMKDIKKFRPSVPSVESKSSYVSIVRKRYLT